MDNEAIQDILKNNLKTSINYNEDGTVSYASFVGYAEATKAIQELLIKARIEERLKIYQMKESIRPSWFLYDKELQKRIKLLNKEPV